MIAICRSISTRDLVGFKELNFEKKKCFRKEGAGRILEKTNNPTECDQINCFPQKTQRIPSTKQIRSVHPPKFYSKIRKHLRKTK